jgi:hypothetical protein
MRLQTVLVPVPDEFPMNFRVGACFFPRYQFQNTKSPELIFSALLADDGARDVRFERVLCT